MSFVYTDAVFELGQIKFYTQDMTEFRFMFTVVDKSVLNALATRANEDGECWPGYGQLAYDAAVSRNSVIRSIEKLRSIGLISFDIGGGRGTNYYKLNLPLIRKFASEAKEAFRKGRGRGSLKGKAIAKQRAKNEETAGDPEPEPNLQPPVARSATGSRDQDSWGA